MREDRDETKRIIYIDSVQGKNNVDTGCKNEKSLCARDLTPADSCMQEERNNKRCTRTG